MRHWHPRHRRAFPPSRPSLPGGNMRDGKHPPPRSCSTWVVSASTPFEVDGRPLLPVLIRHTSSRPRSPFSMTMTILQKMMDLTPSHPIFVPFFFFPSVLDPPMLLPNLHDPIRRWYDTPLRRLHQKISPPSCTHHYFSSSYYFNSLTAIGAHERQLFDKLLW